MGTSFKAKTRVAFHRLTGGLQGLVNRRQRAERHHRDAAEGLIGLTSPSFGVYCILHPQTQPRTGTNMKLIWLLNKQRKVFTIH
jgi:hypothetical protein